MADQASVSRGNGSNIHASPLTLVGNIADFGNDIASLAELQAKLALLDAKEAANKATTPLLGLVSGVALALGSLPVILIGLADVIASSTKLSSRRLPAHRRPGGPGGCRDRRLRRLEGRDGQPEHLPAIDRGVDPEPLVDQDRPGLQRPWRRKAPGVTGEPVDLAQDIDVDCPDRAPDQQESSAGPSMLDGAGAGGPRPAGNRPRADRPGQASRGGSTGRSTPCWRNGGRTADRRRRRRYPERRRIEDGPSRCRCWA